MKKGLRPSRTTLWICFALGSALVLAAPRSSAQPLAPVPPPNPAGVARPPFPAKEAAAVYLVQLNAPGAASYKGGQSGFAATKPAAGERLDATAGQVETYVKHLEQTHDRLLASIGAPDAKVYSFRYAFNGFAARLTAAEASRLAHLPDVARVSIDTEQRVQTDNSAVFLGLLDQNGGLRADLGLRGEGIVVGIIDSGIAPDHPSLRDSEQQIPRACQGRWATASWLGLILCHAVRNDPPLKQTYDPPAAFHGTCQAGDGFSTEFCNNKIVGARYYIDGFLARNELDPGEFISPRDAAGHGTHIATIVAGNSTTATLFGTRIATISGIAPRAHIAVYKACWLRPGIDEAHCATSDLARAIDDAVADGVDIINYSVGSLDPDLTAPDDLALLNALDAGVLTVVAAGNDGPELATIGSPSSAPWVLTVAATTQTGTYYEEALEALSPPALAGLVTMREGSFTRQLRGSPAIEGAVMLVDDGEEAIGAGGVGTTRDACEPLVNRAELAGKIALIERGGCLFEIKIGRVEEAGAIAAIVYNDAGAPITMNGTTGGVAAIPGVMIGTADGQDFVDALAAGQEVTVRLEKGVLAQRRGTGFELADFSSRGPALSEPDFLKPDVTAPGVNILGGHTPDYAHGLRGEYFQYRSGTSMAAPEVVGIAALLKQANPSWSPSTLKSALMSSAYARVVREDAETPASAFDMGAGHIDPNLAIDPGLVYDSGYLDHAAYLCGLDGSPLTPVECGALVGRGFSSAPRDLNLPSIGITELVSGDAITRRVTNVGPTATYRATLDAPPGVTTVVTPASLTLTTGESAVFTLAFTRQNAELDYWTFGALTWSDGARDVASPIAVRPVTLRAPREISLTGTSGSGSLAVAFGYTGASATTVHGLHAPGLRESAHVDEDLTNRFDFRTNSGVNSHYFTLSPGESFVRVALFDELTDGADDLDLYLFHCPTPTTCTQVGQSGSFTSAEEIDLWSPEPGLYAALVHGFETDPIAGGPGADYELFAWSVGSGGDAGNLRLAAPASVNEGDRLDLGYDFGPLAGGTRYLGAVAHHTPFGRTYVSIVTVDAL
jgi:subtilisin family serine protease